MMRCRLIVILIGVLAFFMPRGVLGESVPPQIGEDIAAKIVEKIISNPNVGIFSEGPPDQEGFYEMTLMFSGRDGIRGRLAVNSWTGDVWRMNYCGRRQVRMSSPAARLIQDDVRKKLALPDAAYRRLKSLRPPCLVL